MPARSLHSVAGRFRFGVLGRALMVVFGPPLLVVIAIGSLGASDPAPWTTADLVWFFVIGMLLTPLGAATNDGHAERVDDKFLAHVVIDRPAGDET